MAPGQKQYVDTSPKPFGSKHADGTPVLNRYSTALTGGHEYPGAQAMLYAAGIKTEADMKLKPQVGKFQLPSLPLASTLTLSKGIATVWWQGNPCK